MSCCGSNLSKEKLLGYVYKTLGISQYSTVFYIYVPSKSKVKTIGCLTCDQEISMQDLYMILSGRVRLRLLLKQFIKAK